MSVTDVTRDVPTGGDNSYHTHAVRWREIQRRAADESADDRERYLAARRYYYRQLQSLLAFIVEPDKRVLSVKSDLGESLQWVKPSRGVGLESSGRLVELARRKAPRYEFHQVDLEQVEVDETFDYILVVNGVNALFDVQETFSRLRRGCEEHTRLVVVFYNFLWQPLVRLAERVGFKMRQPEQNWLSLHDVATMCGLAGFEVVREYRTVLLPAYVPILSWFLNRVVAGLPLFRHFCFVQTLVARPRYPPSGRNYRVSVVVPCKNEAGNIEAIVRRTPEMGSHTEIVFCDDRSTDGTAAEVQRQQALHPERDIRLITGPGVNKAENVWAGFDAASGDVLMILDADLAVPPEELSKFYSALARGDGEFINGSRMVYPMQAQAMRLLNVFGNKGFSLLFSYILGQPIKDTLCGTKVLWHRDYERFKRYRGSWGIADRWGDYELIFGAARCNLRLVELPVHYMERVHGETKMTNRLRNALIMFRMSVAAYRKFRA